MSRVLEFFGPELFSVGLFARVGGGVVEEAFFKEKIPVAFS